MGKALKFQANGVCSVDVPRYNQMSYDVPANTTGVSFFLQSLPNAVLSMTGDVEGWKWDGSVKLADAGNPYTVSSTPSASLSINIKSGNSGGRLIVSGIYGSQEGFSDGLFSLMPTYSDNVDCFRWWFKGTIERVTAGYRGAISDLVEMSPHLVNLTLGARSFITGNLSDVLPVKNTLEELTIAESLVDMSDAVDALGELTSLTRLRITVSPISAISIEDIVRKWIMNGKTSGSLNAQFASGFTFNGSSVAAAESALSWTATTATYKGVTVIL